MSRVQNHPLNFMKIEGSSNVFNKENMINQELSHYFSNVSIERIEGKNYIRNYNVPVIALFINANYREKYLENTKNSSDSNVIKLRKILVDETLRKKHYCLMIERIGDTLRKYRTNEFLISTVEYTRESFKDGGKRQKYYLNLNGVKKDDENVKDLTNLYFQIKTLREKADQVAKQKTLSKNA